MRACWDAFLDCVCPAPPGVFVSRLPPVSFYLCPGSPRCLFTDRKTPGGAGTHTGQTHEPHKPNPLKTNPPTDSRAPDHTQTAPVHNAYTRVHYSYSTGKTFQQPWANPTLLTFYFVRSQTQS